MPPGGQQTEDQTQRAALYCSAASGLEAKNRSSGDAQVVLRAIMEIHFVTNIKAQSDDGGEELDAASRVECSASGAVAKIKVAEHRAKSCGVDANFKICKPALSKDKGTDCSPAGLEFRSNKPVQHTDIGTDNGCGAAG